MPLALTDKGAGLVMAVEGCLKTFTQESPVIISLDSRQIRNQTHIPLSYFYSIPANSSIERVEYGFKLNVSNEQTIISYDGVSDSRQSFRLATSNETINELQISSNLYKGAWKTLRPNVNNQLLLNEWRTAEVYLEKEEAPGQYQKISGQKIIDGSTVVAVDIMAVLTCKLSRGRVNRYQCVRKCQLGPTRIVNLKEGTQLFDNILTIVHESGKMYYVKVVDIATCLSKEEKFDLTRESNPKFQAALT